MDTKKTDTDIDTKDDTALRIEGESLEFSGDATDTNANGVSDQTESTKNTTDAQSPVNSPSSNTLKSTSHISQLWRRFNIYLLIFVLLIFVAIAVSVTLYLKSHETKTATNNSTITPQKLSSESLQQLANNGVQVGDPKQVLSIQSNSVFAGTVLVKGELQVAGGLKIGSGGLAIPDVNIGGTALINQLQAKSLAVAGNSAIQGQLSVQQNLSVNGSGAFNGPVSTPQLTAGKLQISGDLAITRHLVAGGSIPKRTNGNLGTGGSSSVSGSDTAGSVTINTGSGPGSGCMVTISFAQAFNSTPHLSLTPIGSSAAGLSYYADRTTGSFSICSTTPPPANQTFGFDYIVLD